MTFIKREELPATLRSAYDIAAKGTENDTSRPEGMKNNPKLIDSCNEVLIFEQEVEKAKISDKLKYSEYTKINNAIKNFKNNPAFNIFIVYSGNAYDPRINYSIRNLSEYAQYGQYASPDAQQKLEYYQDEVKMLQGALAVYNKYNAEHPYLSKIKKLFGFNKSPQNELSKMQDIVDMYTQNMQMAHQYEQMCQDALKEQQENMAEKIQEINNSW